MTLKDKLKIKQLKFKVRIIVEKDDPGYHAFAPSLPGLHMPGNTRKEALENAKEAAALMLKVMIEDGDSIPLDVIAPTRDKFIRDPSKKYYSSLAEIIVDY